MTNDEQGPVGADGRGDARAPYERPELRELSVSETLTGPTLRDVETFLGDGTPFEGDQSFSAS
jgi:hypothetical protein